MHPTEPVLIRLRIQTELCGPIAIGTVSIVKLLHASTSLSMKEALTLVDRCVFDGETATIALPQLAAAQRLLAALQKVPPPAQVVAEIIATDS